MSIQEEIARLEKDLGYNLSRLKRMINKELYKDTEILDYDCGLLGGDEHQTTEWWHDYIRSELSACNHHWKSQLDKQ